MIPPTGLFVQLPQPWTPHKFQKAGVKWLLEHACAALFADPGVGKTSMTLGALKVLKKRGMMGKVLIIAPLRVAHQVWPSEVRKWKDFNDFKVVVLHGPDKEKLLEEEADLYVINPEGLDWLLGVTKAVSAKTGKRTPTVNLKRFKSLGFDHLIIDELSKFKNSQSQRFKALKQVTTYFRRRWGLTGSPAANGLMDLFGQAYVLDEGNALGPYITHFRNKYFLPDYDGFGWTLREGAEDEIYEAIAPLAMRIGSEHLDLPKLVDNEVEIHLPADARRMYMELEEFMIAELDQGFITAKNAAVMSGKCRQVASGGIFVDNDQFGHLDAKKLKKAKVQRDGARMWASVHTAKVDALEDLIEELQGQPLLVAYDFHHDLCQIRQRLGKDIPFIGGGTTTKEAKDIEALWNAGKIPVLLGHPQAMAHGLNMQMACSHVAWYSMTWNFELYDQMIKRVHRQGNKSPRVFVHHLMAQGTIDEAIFWALKNKRKGQNALFEAIKLLKKRRRT